MKTMDRRMAERRHGVTEQNARNRLRILIVLVSLVALAGAGLWLVRSPLLGVDRVTVTGVEHSDAAAIIERLGVTTGTPTISVDAAALEDALRSDPWIAAAAVTVTWPGSVEVEVDEHEPVAVVQMSDGFAHVTAAGHVVQRLEDASGRALIVIPNPGTVQAGSVLGQPALIGALEFVAALPLELVPETSVAVGSEDQIQAAVAGYQVRLGRAVDMPAKAAALVAVIEHGIDPGSFIDVTAPRRPAVTNPQAEVEGEG